MKQVIEDERREENWAEFCRDMWPDFADWLAEIGRNNPISFSWQQQLAENNPIADDLLRHYEQEFDRIAFEEMTTMRDPTPIGF